MLSVQELSSSTGVPWPGKALYRRFGGNF